MRKVNKICFIFFSALLASLMIAPLAKASITNYNWVGTLLRSTYDSFYGTSVTGYEEGATASLVVNVYNDYGGADQANISAVLVGFDWGVNYTSGECSIDTPFELDFHESHVFTISFTVPSTSVASNFVTHTYTIYVEHVNSTTGNKGKVGTWTWVGSSFAVFSSDQAEAFKYKRELEAYPMYTFFLTSKARELMTQSTIAKTMGSSDYTAGKFDTAKSHYQNALELMQQAWSNETEKWSTFEDTFVGILQGAESLLVMQGYSWLIFGIGFLLMGIGVLVYLTRKSGAPKTS